MLNVDELGDAQDWVEDVLELRNYARELFASCSSSDDYFLAVQKLEARFEYMLDGYGD